MKWRRDLFITFNDDTAEHLFAKAKERILYVAPSLSLSVAQWLVFHSALVPAAVIKVIVDPNYDSLLLGYGELSGLTFLTDHGIDVREQEGIRIGVLLIDDRSWVFTPTPQIVERPPEAGTLNGMLLSPEYTRWLLKSLAPDLLIRDDVFEDLGLRATPEDPDFPRDPDDDVLGSRIFNEPPALEHIEIDFTPELGTKRLNAETIEDLRASHEERPPRKFDHEREVLVYNGYLQFVDLNFVGGRLTARKVRLPDCLVDVASASKARIDIEASCRLFETAERTFPDLKHFERRVKHLRSKYLVVLGEQLGSVILSRQLPAFESELGECRTELERISATLPVRIEQELKLSKERILKTLIPVLLENPAPWMTNYSDEPSVKAFLSPMLDECFPGVEEITGHLDLCYIRKDVTWEMLNSKQFGEAIKEAFPDENFTKLYAERKTLGEQTDAPKSPITEVDLWPDTFGADEDM